MPELPDILAYVDALRKRIEGRELQTVRILSPFLLRTAEPPITSVLNRRVKGIRRVGKRIAIGFDGDLWLVLHLMIAARLHWKPEGTRLPARGALAAFQFPNGTLTLTEAGTKHRASLQLVQGDAALTQIDRGGVDPLTCSLAQFGAALRAQNHTLKRALTDPQIVDGIGNAYSDEILHAARLSPLKLAATLSDEHLQRLYEATRATLTLWIERLRAEAAQKFPEHVTAFREEMAVHGRYGKPCPDCGSAIKRIRYADNETNYCPSCQTGGRVLADRGLSRLLK